jgi:uncharacterized Zn-binding protein involved in type VI secretion
MSRGTARLNDRTIGVCSHPSHPVPITIGGTIITASSDTNANTRGIARLRDTVLTDCGHRSRIITGSPNHKINGRPTARLNDRVGDGPYSARIITASGNTNVNQ